MCKSRGGGSSAPAPVAAAPVAAENIAAVNVGTGGGQSARKKKMTLANQQAYMNENAGLGILGPSTLLG